MFIMPEPPVISLGVLVFSAWSSLGNHMQAKDLTLRVQQHPKFPSIWLHISDPFAVIALADRIYHIPWPLWKCVYSFKAIRFTRLLRSHEAATSLQRIAAQNRLSTPMPLPRGSLFALEDPIAGSTRNGRVSMPLVDDRERRP